MRGLSRTGEFLFEVIAITLIVAVAACTVVLFFPVTVGLAGYFDEDKEERRLRDIFITIGKNWKMVICYTVFQIIIIVVPILNILYFQTDPEGMNAVVLAISCVLLVVGIFYMATSPTIIVNMNVTFLQLLYNGIMLLFGGLGRSLLAVLIIAGIVLLILYFPYVLILVCYLAPWAGAKLMLENLLKLKAKALGTTVEELKKQQNRDDYLDEYGNVKPGAIPATVAAEFADPDAIPAEEPVQDASPECTAADPANETADTPLDKTADPPVERTQETLDTGTETAEYMTETAQTDITEENGEESDGIEES